MLIAELVELAERIQKGQTDAQLVEVKSAREDCPKKLYNTLSAFSNQDQGGTLVFGLNEKTWFKAVGVYDPLDLQKNVTDQCNQMEPPVEAVFTAAEYQGVTICAAEIPGIDLAQRPCYYKGAGRTKGSCLRAGGANLQLTDYELYAYEAYRKQLHDDERPVTRASLKLLDPDRLAAYISKKEKQKSQLSLADEEQVYEMLNVTRSGAPTLAALMSFCVYPQGLFPQLGIEAAVMSGYGTGSANAVDHKRIEGPISDMVKEAAEFCKRNMKTKITIDPDTGMREDKTDYPINAVREAILNALVHRDYSAHTEKIPVQVLIFADRLEIHSPGTLYGRMTIDQLGKTRPELRNPALAVMAESQLGPEIRYSGIPAIREEMKAYDLPDPVFENRRDEFVVIFYNDIRSPLAMRVAEDQAPYYTDAANTTGMDIPADADFPACSDKTTGDLLEFCRKPRTRKEIADFLDVKTIFYVSGHYIKPLLDSGYLAMTMPEKPKSKLQRYYTAGSGPAPEC
ncbi:putative DNA binding domain-containing protein [Ihubacter massiliensis]|uniref:DNA binding domain-containing protein n=1 Tax=Hominibacterium faecale TaxID=2839743 RepID=A0A9J6QVB8_9FIRM|nr:MULTISPECIES: ATP-binding protein [Eubacteriales Family XIII. Incertae Sedis]MCO7121042.1 putative DNA binding domain-containing protein [Ihubacter massiliensis]MCU7377958.1 putative DNA binding domain-containing protein [Hominibacterium faecale]